MKTFGAIVLFIIVGIVFWGILMAISEATMPVNEYIYLQPGEGGNVVLFMYALFLTICFFAVMNKLWNYLTYKTGRSKKPFEWKSFISGFLLFAGVPHLIFLPLLYFAVHNYIAFTEKEVVVAPFWDLTNHRYSWDAIDAIEAGYEYDEGSYYGDYTLYFIDGRDWNLWEEDVDVAAKIVEIDRLAKTLGVEKEFWNMPFSNDLYQWADESGVSSETLHELFMN